MRSSIYTESSLSVASSHSAKTNLCTGEATNAQPPQENLLRQKREVYLSYAHAQKIRQSMPWLDTENENILFSNSKMYGDALRTCLDKTTLSTLESFKNDPLATVLLARGLPCDIDLPPTPYDRDRHLGETPLTIAINIALYHVMGIYPVTYQGENNNRLFRDVAPKKNAMKESSSQGSALAIGMHVDNCHLPLTPEAQIKNRSIAPEYLSLFSLRCDLRVPTKIAFLEQIIAHLDLQTIEILKQPLFEFIMPDSFSVHQKFQLPILVQDDCGTYYIRFDSECVTPLNDAATVAFQRLQQVLCEKSLTHHLLLQPGDFLIFKNQQITHARESFQARFDGTDRWLLRLFGMNSLERTIPVDSQKPYLLVSD